MSQEAGGGEAGAQRRDLVVVQGDQWAADAAVVEHAEQLEGCLGGGGSVVGDAHDGVEGREQRGVDPQRLGVVARTQASIIDASWGPAAWATTETSPQPP